MMMMLHPGPNRRVSPSHQWIVVVILVLVGSPTMATTSSRNEGNDKDAYDDTRRMACMLAINAFAGGQDSAMNQAAEVFLLDSIQLEIMEKTTDMLVTRTSYRSGPLLTNYKQACEDLGGFFDVFTGVLDCISHSEYSDGKATMDTNVNMAQCFSPGPECSNYTALDWQLDTKQVFKNTCAVRAGTIDNVESILSVLISSSDSAAMPQGEPNFVDKSAGYSNTRRNTCFNAFKKGFNAYPELEDAALHHNGKMRQIELLQDTPILTQRESYLNDDGSLEKYQQLCADSGWTLDFFNGTLDCLGFGKTNIGVKTTTVAENAAGCFPSTGCSGYTFDQWRIDTMMHMGEQSCTVRSSTPSENDMDTSSPPLPATPARDSEGGDEPLTSPSILDLNSNNEPMAQDDKSIQVVMIPLLSLGLISLAIGVYVALSHRRQRHHQQQAAEYELSSSIVMADDFQSHLSLVLDHDDDDEEEAELPPIT